MKKNIQKLTFLLISFFAVFQSCSSDSPKNTGSAIPTDLKITTEILGATTINPNGDGSGTVKFKATATNAATYQILVDGKTVPMTNG